MSWESCVGSVSLLNQKLKIVKNMGFEVRQSQFNC